MSDPASTPPLDPEAAQVVARIRRLMLISGAGTGLALAVVFGIIGYRVFTGEGSRLPADAVAVTAVLPPGARLMSTAVGGDRIVVTIETRGGYEVRSFDLKTLKPVGRIAFTPAP